MKLSVSVPDGVWEQARAGRPDLNPSGLVRVGLEALLGEERTAFSHERPADAEAAFAHARDRLAAHARSEFENGYRAALSVVKTIDWWVLEALADQHFNVRSWAENLALVALGEQGGELPKGAGPDQATLMSLSAALGPVLPWGDEDAVPGPSAPYLRGFSAAMRDLWEAAFEGRRERSTSGSRSGARSVSSESSRSGPRRGPTKPASQHKSQTDKGPAS